MASSPLQQRTMVKVAQRRGGRKQPTEPGPKHPMQVRIPIPLYQRIVKACELADMSDARLMRFALEEFAETIIAIHKANPHISGEQLENLAIGTIRDFRQRFSPKPKQ